MDNSIKGLEEGRAIFAYKCVDEVCKVKDENKKIAKEYKSYARRIPMMIKNNGLGPAMAFVCAKGEVYANGNNAYTILYKNIEDWLKKRELLPSEEKLIEYILTIDSSKYREISNEVLAFFTWLRRFVEGMIEDEKNPEDDRNE